MGHQTAKGRQRRFIHFSKSLACLVVSAGPAFAQEKPANGNTYYVTDDPQMPLVGFVLSPEVTAATGFNFQYCDGRQVTVDLETMLPTWESCGDERDGTFAMADLFAGATEVALFDKGAEQIGVLDGRYLEIDGRLAVRLPWDIIPPDVVMTPEGYAREGEEYFWVDPANLRFFKDLNGGVGVRIVSFDGLEVAAS